MSKSREISPPNRNRLRLRTRFLTWQVLS